MGDQEDTKEEDRIMRTIRKKSSASVNRAVLNARGAASPGAPRTPGGGNISVVRVAEPLPLSSDSSSNRMKRAVSSPGLNSAIDATNKVKAQDPRTPGKPTYTSSVDNELEDLRRKKQKKVWKMNELNRQLQAATEEFEKAKKIMQELQAKKEHKQEKIEKISQEMAGKKDQKEGEDEKFREETRKKEEVEKKKYKDQMEEDQRKRDHERKLEEDRRADELNRVAESKKKQDSKIKPSKSFSSVKTAAVEKTPEKKEKKIKEGKNPKSGVVAEPVHTVKFNTGDEDHDLKKEEARLMKAISTGRDGGKVRPAGKKDKK